MFQFSLGLFHLSTTLHNQSFTDEEIRNAWEVFDLYMEDNAFHTNLYAHIYKV